MKDHMLQMCRNLEKATEEKAGLIIPGQHTKEDQNRTTKVMTQIIVTLCEAEGMTPETAEWVLTTAIDIVRKAAMSQKIDTPETTKMLVDEYLAMLDKG